MAQSKNFKLARYAEGLIEQKLIQSGFHIVAKNIRRKGFELDLVYTDKESCICIVEVKARRQLHFNLCLKEQLISKQKIISLRRGRDFLRSKLGDQGQYSYRAELAVVLVRKSQYKATILPLEL